MSGLREAGGKKQWGLWLGNHAKQCNVAKIPWVIDLYFILLTKFYDSSNYKHGQQHHLHYRCVSLLLASLYKESLQS